MRDTLEDSDRNLSSDEALLIAKQFLREMAQPLRQEVRQAYELFLASVYRLGMCNILTHLHTHSGPAWRVIMECRTSEGSSDKTAEYSECADCA